MEKDGYSEEETEALNAPAEHALIRLCRAALKKPRSGCGEEGLL